MFASLLDEKLILWLQRPDEPPKYALSEILPKCILLAETRTSTLREWSKIESDLELTDKIFPVSEVGHIGPKPNNLLEVRTTTHDNNLLAYSTWVANFHKKVQDRLVSHVVTFRSPNIDGIIVAITSYHNIFNNLGEVVKFKWGNSAVIDVFNPKKEVYYSW